MQPQGPPGAQNPFAYNVNTTYIPDEVVPAVPTPAPGPSHGYAPQGSMMGHPQPGMMPPSGYHPGMMPPHPGPGMMPPPPNMGLQFTDTTAPQFVTGKISKAEERQHLVNMGRSDDPAASQPFGAPPPAPGAPGPSGEAQPKEDYTKYPFYNVRRYREYFDVDTTDVLWRVGNSLIGVFRPNFMEVTMKSPDLYGPFWVATTLIFVTAVAGNFSDYIEWRKEKSHTSPPPPPALDPSGSPLSPSVAPSPSSPSSFKDEQWFTDYTKLATSAALFYGYVFIIGLGLFFCIKWFKGELKLVNVFCIYGYCLSIFIPVSIACVVPIGWLKWVLVMTATALSGGFLVMNTKATIFSAAPARAIIIMIVVLALHIGLGLGLRLYFFSY